MLLLLRTSRRPLFGLTALMLLVLVIPSARGQTETNELAQRPMTAANELVDKANAEIRAAKELQTKNEAKIGKYKEALNAGDFAKAASILDSVNRDIDVGVAQGEAAATYLEQASRMDIDPHFSEYLTLRAQSVRQRVASYRELKVMFSIVSEMLRDPTSQTVAQAQPKIRASQAKIAELDRAADALEEKSERIRCANPDSFKDIAEPCPPAQRRATPARRAARPKKRRG